MKKLNADMAYKILCYRINRFLKQNDKEKVLGINRDKLFKILTTEQKELILDKSEVAACHIVHRICNGELTPMMLSDRKKSRSIYIYYLRYLTNKVYKENPEEAKRLAAEVRRDILFNEFIKDKSFGDEQYFSILLEWDKYSYVQKIKRTDRLLDAAIRRGTKKV